MRIVFFGTSNVALPVLDLLQRTYEVAAVVTQPDKPVGRKQELSQSPVSVLAQEMGVKTLKPDRVKGNDLFRMELAGLNADLFIVVAYGKILPKEIIEMPRLKTLNVHFSQLPKYRGPSPIQFALLNGDPVTATSIMVLDEELDHGPVLTAEKYTIASDDNYLSLSTNLAHVSARVLSTMLPDYAEGRLAAVEQDHAQATYTKIITKDDGRVDWSKTSRQIYNQFRAFFPWPGIWTKWNGKVLKITDCSVLEGQVSDQPGTVLDGGTVACGDGTLLRISSLQLEGKAETDIASFLNGYRNFTGSKLGE